MNTLLKNEIEKVIRQIIKNEKNSYAIISLFKQLTGENVSHTRGFLMLKASIQGFIDSKWTDKEHREYKIKKLIEMNINNFEKGEFDA